MIRVINSIQFDEQLPGYHPELLGELGPGLLVLLDVKQQPAFLVDPGSSVSIRRPDGTVFNRTVAGIEIWGQHVGLFFKNTEQHEIPNTSEIELKA
jgi:hypothetical protein